MELNLGFVVRVPLLPLFAQFVARNSTFTLEKHGLCLSPWSKIKWTYLLNQYVKAYLWQAHWRENICFNSQSSNKKFPCGGDKLSFRWMKRQNKFCPEKYLFLTRKHYEFSLYHQQNYYNTARKIRMFLCRSQERTNYIPTVLSCIWYNMVYVAMV